MDQTEDGHAASTFDKKARVATLLVTGGDSVLAADSTAETDSRAAEMQPEREVDPAASLRELTEKLFDAECYVGFYNDLRSSNLRRFVDESGRHVVHMGASDGHPGFPPITHFIDFGMREGRAPSITFDIAYTMHRIAKFDDVRLAHGDVFAYFAQLPKSRRFVPNPWFSPWAFRKRYVERYPELAEFSDYGLFEFYVERASYAALSPCGTFHEENYRLRYRDVASAIGRAHFSSGFAHFIIHGGQDGRVNLPGVLPPDLGALPGVIAAREVQWLMSGQVSVAPLVWWFDAPFYLGIYPDVHELVRVGTIKSALEHYLVEGYRQGRVPSPSLMDRLPAQDDPDPWLHFESLTPPKPDDPQRSLTLGQAAALLRYLDRPGWTGTRAAASEVLWRYVAPPAVDGVLAVDEYLAISLDVATNLGHSQDAVREHWKYYGAREHRPAPGSNIFGRRQVTLQDALAWRSGVNYFGPVNSPSGLGSSARGYAAALEAAGVPIDVRDTTWLLDASVPADILAPEDLRYSINMFCLNADQIVPLALRYGTALFQHRANVAVWVWELPAPLCHWRSSLAALDLIVVPSEFCRKSFALSTDLPIAVVPHVVDAAKLEALSRQATANYWLDHIARAKASGKRIVLFIMDASSYTARKGVDVYCELAERIGRKRPGEFLFVLKSHSQDISLNAAESYRDPVLDVRGVFSFANLCALKALADLYVSPHRSEGFGLNIVESILLRVPVLCSDFGGIADVLASIEPQLVSTSLSEVGRDMGPYRAEALWGEPDIDFLEAEFLRFFATQKRSRRFHAVRQRLTDELSAAAIGARLVEELTRWCGYGAERSPAGLEAFRHLAQTPRQETFVLGYVTPDTRRSADAPGVERMGEIVAGARRPIFSIVTPTYNTDPAWLEELYDDLVHQSLPSWEWCIADDGSTRPETLETLRALRLRDSRIQLLLGRGNTGISAATNAGVGITQGRYLVFIDHDDRVASRLLEAYNAQLDIGDFDGIIYCDEDKILPSGQLGDTYCKPDWSPEHVMSCMYVLHCLCVRKSLFLKLGGYRPDYDGAQDHDFVLRAAAAGAPIRHVDEILYHWRVSPRSMASTPDAKVPAIETGRRVVRDYVHRIGLTATVENGLIPGSYRVRPTLPRDPVELNILTGCTPLRSNAGCSTAGESRTFVEQFVRSILEHSPDLDYRIRLVVDSDKVDIAAPLAQLDSRIAIVPFTRQQPAFNFAAMANFAIAGCVTDRVVLLNDDMLAEGKDWLPALLEPLQFKGVGVVGGHLLYGDSRQQHCGIVLGVLGPAAHIFEGEVITHIGYNAFNRVMRNYSAVTGAMMAFRRSTFERVHGLDTSFPIDFNDVDFCLRVGRTGLRVVYTPFAQLRHFESRSARRLIADPLDRERFYKRWSAVIERDPYYNRNLPRDNAMCVMDYNGEVHQTLALKRPAGA
jgi:GT2 family glycosyltransferase/glycosyltransferase involved in cell wall biosynthesis